MFINFHTLLHNQQLQGQFNWRPGFTIQFDSR